MVKDSVKKKIDKVIKETWLKEICREYGGGLFAQEIGLQCAMYHHLRAKLDPVMKREGLFIYPGFTFKEPGHHADLAVCQADMSKDVYYLEEALTDIAAVVQLRFSGSQEYFDADVPRLKQYVQDLGFHAQYYFGVIQETEQQIRLPWLDPSSMSRWAEGCFTQLSAGYQDDGAFFEVTAYNGLNIQSKRVRCELR